MKRFWSSVKVYLHTRAKVRHDRFHVFGSNAQRSWWDGSRVVGKLSTTRREDLCASIEDDAGVAEVGNGALSARNRLRRGGILRRWRSFWPELHGHLAQQRAFTREVHPCAIDRDIQMKSLVEFCLSLGQLDCDAQLVLLRLDDRVGALTLGGGHMLTKLFDVVVVLDALRQ